VGVVEGVGDRVGEGLGLGVEVSSVGVREVVEVRVRPADVSAGLWKGVPDGEADSAPEQAVSNKTRIYTPPIGRFIMGIVRISSNGSETVPSIYGVEARYCNTTAPGRRESLFRFPIFLIS
jgi:hypothetical protein